MSRPCFFRGSIPALLFQVFFHLIEILFAYLSFGIALFKDLQGMIRLLLMIISPSFTGIPEESNDKDDK